MTGELDEQLLEHAQRQTKALETISLVVTLFAVLVGLAIVFAGIVYLRGA